MFGAHRKKHGIVGVLEFGGGDISADLHVAVECHPLGFHLLDAAVDDILLHLEIGDAIDE